MRRGYLFTIAWRHLIGQRRQSLLTVLGVAVGVMVLLIISGLMNGLLVSFTDTVVDAAPHLTVTAERDDGKAVRRLPELAGPDALLAATDRVVPDTTERLAAYPPLMRQIEGIPAVEVVSPHVYSQVIAVTGAETKPLLIVGIVPEREERLVQLASRVSQGRFETFRATPGTLLLGEGAAKDLDAVVGDRLRLVSARGQVAALQVAGLYKTGVKALDERAYVHVRVAQAMEEFDPGSVSALAVRLRDVGQVEGLAPQLRTLSGRRVETWRETNASIIGLFRMISTISTLLVVFTIVVAGFGVANVLVTVVLGKSRDISLLRSIGFTRRRVLVLFLLEGLLLGLAGAVLGCALGWLATALIGLIPVGGSDFRSGSTLYLDQNPRTYMLTAGFALLVCLVASVGPARRAAKLQPVSVLRGEA